MARIPYFYSDTPLTEKITELDKFLETIEQERKPLLAKRGKLNKAIDTLEACQVLAEKLRTEYKAQALWNADAK